MLRSNFYVFLVMGVRTPLNDGENGMFSVRYWHGCMTWSMDVLNALDWTGHGVRYPRESAARLRKMSSTTRNFGPETTKPCNALRGSFLLLHSIPSSTAISGTEN
jgi:hypothetical protein